VAQPHGPSSPGQAGLLLLPPATVRSEDDAPLFHVFVNVSRDTPEARAGDRTYRYLGAYAKVPTIRTTVEVDEWLSLPNSVSPLLSQSGGSAFGCLQLKVIRLTPPPPCS
jgi:hypothetical protein